VADEVRCLAEVRLWGQTVGALAELGSGRIVFEYDPAFVRSGLDISPLRLPPRRGPVTFEELRRKQAFQGLPGVFADSLPDAFGNRVIRAYYAGRGETELAMSPVQRLLYVGRRAIGALTYHPEEVLPVRPAEQESLEIANLVREARRIVEGSPEVAVPEIYRIGSSAGGMRPKALVLHDASTGRLRSGAAVPNPGERPCILKFDGVGDPQGMGPLAEPAPFNRVEAAYAHMARDAGIAMARLTMLEASGGYAHLLVERFDLLPTGGRLHQHTLGGLTHIDYNDVGASSYEEYLRVGLTLGLPPADIEEAFRRMVFNVVAVNQDDHVKNLSFHMMPDGRWRLTPAYDVTFARGSGFTATHQMRVNDRLTGVARADLLIIADDFGVKRASAIIDQAIEITAQWPKYAAETGVPSETVRVIDGELAGRREELV
jgi:serine/threonine-protein kinase HipA